MLEDPNIADIRQSLLNMLLAVDTQVLEGPNIDNIRSLLNMLLVGKELRLDTQVLEGPNIADIGSLLNMLLVQYCQSFCNKSLQLCVARTTGAGSTTAVSSHYQCFLVSVRLFIV